MQEIQVQSLGQEDTLEKEMATQSSILAPWTEEPGGLQFIRLQRVKRDWASERVQTPRAGGVVPVSSAAFAPLLLRQLTPEATRSSPMTSQLVESKRNRTSCMGELAPTGLGSSSFSVISSCLFTLFMGFSRQEYSSGLPFPSPVDHVLSELSSMTCLSWWPYMAWLIVSLS